MINAFTSVYNALQAFFSRGFWFAAFLPVALFALLHAIVASQVIGPVTLLGIELRFDDRAPDLSTAAPAIFVALIVIAYALLPLTPLLHGLLDGSYLPQSVHDWLRSRRLVAAHAIRTKIDAARDDLAAVKEMNKNAHDDKGRLRTAYRAALALPSATGRKEIESAKAELQRLQRLLLSPSGSLIAACKTAEATVIAALARNNPNPEAMKNLCATPPAIPVEEIDLAIETDKVSSDLETLLIRAVAQADYRYQILRTRYRVFGALDIPRATLIGDARLAVERYAYDVYQVDFDFLWSRLLVAMKAEKADDALLEAIDTARASVDFAVLSLALATSIPAVWLPVICFHYGPAWLFLAIGVATPVVLNFFYRLVFEGQLAFGRVVKTTIDRHRFLVLKMMRQAEPQSRAEERSLWRRIAQAEADGRSTDLVYVAPPAKKDQ